MGNQITAKYFVDEAFFNSVVESSLLRLDPIEKFKLDEQDSILLNSILTSPKTIIEYQRKLMLITYLKTIELGEKCLQYSMIRIMNSITLS